MITAADISQIAPELADVTPARVAIFSELAQLHLNKNHLGIHFQTAQLLLVAHLLTLSSRGGNPGSVTSESVGEVSRSYSSSSGSESSFSSTTYGQMYLDLISYLPRTPIVV